MKKLVLLTCIAISSLGLVGCQQYQHASGERQVVGTVLGGVVGGLAGAAIGSGSGQVIAAAAGALFGGIIGGNIASNMDQTDRRQANTAFKKACNSEIGHTQYWDNQPTGHSGSVRAVRDGISSNGLYCREFQTTVYVDGRAERMYGTACRMKDGSWQPV